MLEFRADMHCHTTCSDGTMSPEEIVKLACDSGLQGLSITDHDTIEAYKTAIPIAQNLGLAMVSGVEFSAIYQDTSVHVLAYSFPLESTLIQEFCRQHEQQRNQRNQEILDLLSAHGMPLSQEEIQDHDLPFKQTIGRPHIASAMLKKGYVSSIQQAFNQYIGDGCSCYAIGHYFSVEETIELIHQAKGLAVIAHPHLIENSSVLTTLLHMNFDGIEGYYGRFLLHQHERWLKIGKRKGWIITGGSDFHGTIKPNLALGSSWVNLETFNVLQHHFQQNMSPSK